MSMTNQNWSVGQSVAYNADYGRGVNVGDITRLTKTQIVAQFGTSERRFRISDGKEVGYTGGWNVPSWLRPATDKDLAAFKRQRQSGEAVRLLEKITARVRDHKSEMDYDAVLERLADIDAMIEQEAAS